MRISVQGQLKELPIYTVMVSKNLKNPDNVYLFRCYECSTGIDQVQGKVTELFPGLIQSENVNVIHKCAGCGISYVFHTRHSTRNYIRVTLAQPVSKRSVFHCLRCRKEHAQIRDGALLINGKQVKFPHSLDCSGIGCDFRYRFDELI